MDSSPRVFAEWLDRQSKREKRGILLHDALLGNRFWAYAFYRLRYFCLRLGVESGIHAVRLLLLFSIFSQREFAAILLIQVSSGVLVSFWWGALEVMRGRVRALYRDGSPHLISPEIGKWLSLSVQISIMTIAIGGVSMAWLFTLNGVSLSPADLYIASIFINLSMTFVARCYHSGIYSVRRIYRPVQAIIGVQLVSFLGILALWPWLGPWSFPIAEITSSVIATALTFHYTRRMFGLAGYAPGSFLDIKHLQFPFRRSVREGIAAGSSNVLMNLESLLVLVLFSVSLGHTNVRTELFVLLFIVGPTIRAGSDWAQLFYFDLKRLESSLFESIRKRFEKHIMLLACLMAILLWAFSCLLLATVDRSSLRGLYYLLVPFFVARSLFAAVQVQAFSRKMYNQLLISGGLFVGAAVVSGFLLDDTGQKIIVVSGGAFISMVVLKYWLGTMGMDTADRKTVLPTEWLAMVSDCKEPVRISAVHLEEDYRNAANPKVKRGDRGSRWRQRKLTERIGNRLGQSGKATSISSGCIAWYEHGDVNNVDNAWLLQQGAGLMLVLGDTGFQSNGLDAVEVACRQKLLGPLLNQEIRGTGDSFGISDVQREFAKMFPQGVVYDPTGPIPALLNSLASQERRRVMSDAISFSTYFTDSKRSILFDVTSLCVAGDMRLIFIVDQRANRLLRSRWRQFIEKANLLVSMNPAETRAKL